MRIKEIVIRNFKNIGIKKNALLKYRKSMKMDPQIL